MGISKKNIKKQLSINPHIPKIIVVGASGYIGTRLLTAAKNIAPAIGISSSGNGLDTLRLQSPDLFDYSLIRPGDLVLLTASISSPDICTLQRDYAWSVNVTGTSIFIKNVINSGARIVFFSSDTVYGECKNEFNESAVCNPAGEYAEMKLEVESRYLGNPSFKTIRLSYVFSLFDKFTRYLIDCVKLNIEAELFHPFFRSIVHREDVVEGVLALSVSWNEVPEQVINFGGPQVLSRVDFADCLREAHLHNLRFKVTEPGTDFFKNRPRVIAMTSPVFARLLGRPQHTLSEAVRLEFDRF